MPNTTNVDKIHTSTAMLRTPTPRNARSKRAMAAREPKEIEDPRTAVFLRGTRTSAVVHGAMQDLRALKRPHAIAFTRANAVRPFEDASALAFWAGKTDASVFVVGQTTKKRPDGMVVVRMYDGRVLDMVEVGVVRHVPMAAFQTLKAAVGHRPMMCFASDVFETHPRYVQLKSVLMDVFRGEEGGEVCLAGLEHVISVTVAPSMGKEEELPVVHVRTYMVRRVPSGTRVPRVVLTEMGPSLDLVLRRGHAADPDMWTAAMRRPKLKKTDVAQGLGKRKKNVAVDAMGDVRGQVHVAKQDLDRLQTRKMKGLEDAGRRKRARIM